MKGARLGQHFLTNPHYARILAEEAGIMTNDTVLEIGPGGGMLTKELLAAGGKVIAIEKDEVLAEKLPAARSPTLPLSRPDLYARSFASFSWERAGCQNRCAQGSTPTRPKNQVYPQVPPPRTKPT